MNDDTYGQEHRGSLKAGVTAAIMLVAFCFATALVMSGSASIAAEQDAQIAQLKP